MNAYTKKSVISSIAKFSTSLQLHRLFSAYSGWGQVLMFHRIVPFSEKTRIHNHQSLEITPEHLEETILYFKNQDYDFYSLDDLHTCLQQQKKPTKKFVVFTFDDGYRDNLTLAYPILKKHQVPFTIYITTNFPDQKAVLWWYMLEDLLLENEIINFEWAAKKYHFDCTAIPKKEATFAAIRTLINQSFTIDGHEAMLATIFKNHKKSSLDYVKELALSWDEICQLSQDPLVTIGAHTVNHFPLKQLPNEQMVEEINESKIILENKIAQSVEHFAYPFGKKVEASVREFDAVKVLGFKTAVTTRIGNVFGGHREFMTAIPRININSVTKGAVLEMQTSGMLPCLYHKGKRIVTD